MVKSTRLFILLCLFVLVSGLSTAQTAPTLIFWSTEDEPERAAATQDIINRFTEKTGINVALMLTQEDLLDFLMESNQRAGTLPDVMFFPLENAGVWYEQGILSAEAATTVINNLGAEQFSALNLVSDGDEGYIAVPTDGWGQFLFYRKDLFEAADLEAPTDFEKIQAAAEALHDPENLFYGIALGNDITTNFTQQTFEHFALANGAYLTDDKGNITLDTPEMVDTLTFYTDLISNYGTPGMLDALAARKVYFDGQAAMLVWSSFILDEMAGLRDNAMPNCPECLEDPAFLTNVTGLIPAFVGPMGDSPVQYGQVSLMGISTSAPPEAIEFVEFWLSEGYLEWLGVAPEGKFPMRQGTPENPTLYVDGWRELEFGVDRRARISDFYSEEVINTIAEGATSFQRWGFEAGQGELVGNLYEQLVIPLLIGDIIVGTITPEEAAGLAQEQAEAIQEDEK